MRNLEATLQSLCLIIHEWLFTDQFLRATLLMSKDAIGSIVGSQISDEEALKDSYEKHKAKVKMIVLMVNIFYYGICVAWAVWVIMEDSFTMRMSKWVLVAI